jgi:hypothetical protein
MRSEFERAVLALKGRRRPWQARIAAVLGSAALIGAAFWGAGAFDRLHTWFADKADVPTAARPARPAPVVPTPPTPAQARSPRLADDGAVGKMRLVATRPGRNTREGTAQLATGNADPLTYVAGALLANGAALLEIYGDHVVLKRDDLTTELYVDGTARSTKPTAVREELITVDKPAVKKSSKTVGPETYTNLMRAAPRYIDAKISGFDVYAGTESGALNRLNLQSGDVLLEIDGRVLTSVEQLHSSLESISAGASLTATVQRGSEQLVLTMDGAMLKEQQPTASLPVP